MSPIDLHTTTRNSALDGVRGIAILLIVFWHYIVLAPPLEPALLRYPSAGGFLWSWSGVDLFFVLSGFLIGGILIDAKSSPTYFKTFYIRRVLRIVPLYYLVLLGFVVVRLLSDSLLPPRAPTDAQYWTFFLFVQNIWSSLTGLWGGPLSLTWSLAVEEQFYLLLPLIVRVTPSKALPPLLALLCVSALLLRYTLFYHYAFGDFATYWLMPCRFDALGLGVLCAVAYRNAHVWQMIVKSRVVVRWVCVTCFVALVYMTSHEMVLGTSQIQTWGLSLVAVMYSCFLCMALCSEGLVRAVVQNRIIGWCGTRAYGIYLLHRIVESVLMPYFGDPLQWSTAYHLTVVICLTLVVFLLSELSYRWIEQPCIIYGKRFKY